MRKHKEYSFFERTTIAFMVATCCAYPAMGGTQGAYMNSAGFGRAVDSVTYAVYGTKSTATSPYMAYPSAGVNPRPGSWGSTANLPFGASPTVYCQSRGFPNYIWSIQAYVTGGSSADNPWLESHLNLVPQTCAEVSIETEAVMSQSNPSAGQMVVTGFATAGAAIGLRGFEFDGTPADLADLIANGQLAFQVLLPGPFVLSKDDCSTVNIPFTTPDPENFFFVVDTAALSVPFEVMCPSDVVFACDEPVVYPPVEVTGGCGNISVVYDPPADALPPGPTTVTVFVSDEGGNTAECSFTAARYLDFDGFYPPINGTGGSCDAPLLTVRRGSVFPVKFSLAGCDGLPYEQGPPPQIRIWSCATGDQVAGGDFQRVADIWHFNVDSNGLPKGVYEIQALIPDVAERAAFFRVR